MPGYDEFVPVPEHLEPPQLDADETLPTQLHPSYPFGRPPSTSRPQRPWMTGPTNLLGSMGMDRLGPGSGAGAGGGGGGAGTGRGESSGAQGDGWLGSRYGQGEGWRELGMEGVVEPEKKREVPPGMAVSVVSSVFSPSSPLSPPAHPRPAVTCRVDAPALQLMPAQGAKRPPSPPSPTLHPGLNPHPRSVHVRNALARQRQSTPPRPTDPFDAPVPNETYADADLSGDRSGAMEGSLEGAALRGSVNGMRTPRESQSDEAMGEEADDDEDEQG